MLEAVVAVDTSPLKDTRSPSKIPWLPFEYMKSHIARFEEMPADWIRTYRQLGPSRLVYELNRSELFRVIAQLLKIRFLSGLQSWHYSIYRNTIGNPLSDWFHGHYIKRIRSASHTTGSEIKSLARYERWLDILSWWFNLMGHTLPHPTVHIYKMVKMEKIDWKPNLGQILMGQSSDELLLIETEFQDIDARRYTEEVHLRTDRDRLTGEPLSGRTEGIFQKEQNRWRIVFKGNSLPLLPSSKGMYYIHDLLGLPNEPIPSSVLYQNVLAIGMSQPKSIYSEIGHERREQEFLFSETMGDGPDMDKKYRGQLRKKFVALRQERKEAVERGDLDLVAKVEQQVDLMVKEFNKATDIHGKDRGRLRQEHNLYRKIYRAIQRAIDKISEYDANLADHLKKSIIARVGHSIYQPATSGYPEWYL